MSPLIQSGDLLVIDRSPIAKVGKIVLAIIDGEFTIKRIKQITPPILEPENKSFPNITISEFQDFSIWGIVIHIIHTP